MLNQLENLQDFIEWEFTENKNTPTEKEENIWGEIEHIKEEMEMSQLCETLKQKVKKEKNKMQKPGSCEKIEKDNEQKPYWSMGANALQLEMDVEEICEIVESFINGNLKRSAERIQDYGHKNFFIDLGDVDYVSKETYSEIYTNFIIQTEGE